MSEISSMYNVEELAKYIGLNDIPKSWYVAYKEIKDRKIPKTILEKDLLSEILEYYEVNDMDFKSNILDTVDLVKKDEKLQIIVYLLYYILYIDNTGLYKDVWNWKMSTNLFKSAGNYMIPVIALLSGCKLHKENMSKKNYDKEQIEEQKKNIRECCLLDKKRFNIDGIRFSQMIWGSYFINGRIIQVGRLQYEYSNEIPNEIAKYKNHDYIKIHIPRGKELNEAEVDESIGNSKNKIKAFYPEIDISKLLFFTESWLLSNELDDILDKESNIIKFKSKFKIIKQIENNSDFLNFVFNEREDNIDYNNLQEKTKLQKELKKFFISNKRLHIGLGILIDNERIK